MAIIEQSRQSLTTVFLADLAHANHSLHSCRSYSTDLAHLCAFHQGLIQTITVEVLRVYFERHTHLRPAIRARKQAAVARFLTWAEQHELLTANPMRKIDRVKPDQPQPRSMERGQIECILKMIPAERLRVSEGLSLYVEDLGLSLDNELLTVVGKGGKQRTIQLDDLHLTSSCRST